MYARGASSCAVLYRMALLPFVPRRPSLIVFVNSNAVCLLGAYTWDCLIEATDSDVAVSTLLAVVVCPLCWGTLPTKTILRTLQQRRVHSHVKLMLAVHLVPQSLLLTTYHIGHGVLWLLRYTASFFGGLPKTAACTSSPRSPLCT